MTRAIKLLLVEDSDDDAKLVLRALRDGGFDVRHERVVSAAAMAAALEQKSWDAIISDYSMPGFSGMDALKLARATERDIPFILISGTVGEEIAVEAMKAGANDYMIKTNISRLASVLNRELQEATNRTRRRRAEFEVRKLSVAIRQSGAGIVITDPAGVIEFVNPKFEAMSGYAASEIEGKNPRFLKSGLTPAQTYRDLWATITAGREWQGEIQNRRKNGELYWENQRITPVLDDKGAILNFISVKDDVTEQKRVAQALRDSEARFRQLAENIHEVFFLIDAANTQMLYVSPAYERIWQRSVASLYADPQSWSDSIYAEDRERVNASIPERQRTGRFDHEYRIVRPDGTLRWIHARGFPIRDETGRPYRIAGIAEDITERKTSEDKVRRLNRVYAVLSGINALIVRVRDPQELFGEACRIAVDAGKFRAAWIGVVDRQAMRVRPVAWHGVEEDYMRLMPLSLADSHAEGRGLSGQAISERKAMVSDDMTLDPRILLKKEALQRGFRSLAVLPLLVAGEAVGILGLYAGEVGFFDDEEMTLLKELAGDIAFAMEHLEALGKVEYLAFHDPLTGLPNRAVLNDRLGQILSAARRERQLAGVMFFDIERFRLINDTLGRQAGDDFLKEVAQRFKTAIRAQDTAARIGADVFAVAVASFSQVTDATHLFSDRLAKAFVPPIVVNGQELRAVLKAGVAIFPNDGDTAETLSRNAEAALKQAKATGERYVFYTPEINARVAESLALENQLRHALEAGQFVLHYQPKVDAKTRAIVGLEALIRWNDPEHGLVPPGKFIPLMEETGIILQAGRWALCQAVTDVQAWRAKGFAAPRVAVNVSQLQLRQKDFVQSVLQALEGFGDAEPVLDIEITESMVMQNFDASVQALQTLRGVGVETSLDDFGTGYSSLAYVARLPVRALKIDRSFVIEMVASKYARTIVETVISLAHSLGLKVIAEGVDAEEQAALLAELGCDQMQGYLICKPVPPEQIEAMLAKA